MHKTTREHHHSGRDESGRKGKQSGVSASPLGCSSFKLRQLSRRVSQHFDHVVGAAGLKTTQYSLLSHVMRLEPVRRAIWLARWRWMRRR